MKKYDKDATCCKCGSGEIEDTHRKAYKHGDNPLYENLTRSFGNELPEPHPEHIARTCSNCGFIWDKAPLDKPSKWEKMRKKEAQDHHQRHINIFEQIAAGKHLDEKEEFSKFLDGYMKNLANQMNISVAELIKYFTVKTSTPPEIRVGDIAGLALPDREDGEEHKVLAQPTNNWYCLDGFHRLINKYELLTRFKLIRKGPKVHTFNGVRLISKGLDHGTHNHGFGVCEKLRPGTIEIEVRFEGNEEQYRKLPEVFTLEIKEDDS